ncbi:hypothetical protein SAMN04488060_1340 [Qipengyuania nanhaisediminis]|jgi:hypothetical protein|uniref:Uncharacterized protein n=1 Tax=Qipengyuania nanhaisediminis TaxID=604088 RepID=A0A1I5MFY1_9SPHN|nr:hypothetical protein SAMN04488060_1340 [Qipengyuania nanhaisediminis]|tara:strand:- start:2473 stop:3258 length:786 start_codon:yes stop_codon:yes gene_type:complete
MDTIEQFGVRENLGEQFLDGSVGARLGVLDAVEKLNARTEQRAHEWSILPHIVGNQRHAPGGEQVLDLVEDRALLRYGDLVKDEAADDLVWPPAVGKLETIEKAVVPPDHIGSGTELALRDSQRCGVGLNADEAGFGAVGHQRPEQGPGAAPDIDDLVAGQQCGLFDDCAAPPSLARKDCDRAIIERREPAFAQRRSELALFWRNCRAFHAMAPIRRWYLPLLLDLLLLRVADPHPSKKKLEGLREASRIGTVQPTGARDA